jgi:pyruvate/2-oxoglutarate dehydrogenase complex dihydrolipoamide acyltransferase (E2) component
MNVDEPGVVAHIKANNDAVVPVGEVIGIVTDSQESYLTYFEALRLEMYEEQKVKEFNEDYELKHQKPSATVLMKVIKGLIRDGKIESGSG